jgi:hypothetical protein
MPAAYLTTPAGMRLLFLICIDAAKRIRRRCQDSVTSRDAQGPDKLQGSPGRVCQNLCVLNADRCVAGALMSSQTGKKASVPYSRVDLPGFYGVARNSHSL